MSFVAAVQSGFRNYVNFKGRATRSEYWWWALFTLVIEAASFIFAGLGDLISLAVLAPSIAVAIRRMHDTDHRGWWMLFPIVNLVFALRASDAGENRFGPPPPPRSLS